MSTLTKSSSSAPATPAPVDYLSDVHLTPGVRDFLKIVNAPDGKSIESLPLSAARQVLVDTQHALPAFIFIHGGGWVLGDYPTHRRLVRDLVVTSGCACVFVNFTLSPEARYPQAIEEIYAATKWVAAHGKEIGVDGANLAIAGNSAGGNMTGDRWVLHRYDGMIHDWGMLNGLAREPGSKSVIWHAAAHLRHYL
jgi:acetyl esterase/lipase